MGVTKTLQSPQNFKLGISAFLDPFNNPLNPKKRVKFSNVLLSFKIILPLSLHSVSKIILKKSPLSIALLFHFFEISSCFVNLKKPLQKYFFFDLENNNIYPIIVFFSLLCGKKKKLKLFAIIIFSFLLQRTHTHTRMYHSKFNNISIWIDFPDLRENKFVVCNIATIFFFFCVAIYPKDFIASKQIHQPQTFAEIF